MEESKERILSAGADGCMAKPLDMDALIPHIRELPGVDQDQAEKGKL